MTEPIAYSPDATEPVQRGTAHLIRRWVFRISPWIVTVIALYIAFNDVKWPVLFNHLGEANPTFLLGAVLLTVCSYLMRSRRWQFLFPEKVMNFAYSGKVLILGFFMNNILPARAGEFVRAHMGAQVAGTTRTLVLATIASERLADGLMLSVMFVAFSFGVGNQDYSRNLFYVALLFGSATIGVLLVLIFRSKIFSVGDRINERINRKASKYAFDRLKIFINGLSPLCTPSKAAVISLWTIVIWSIELCVYFCIAQAFDASLSLPLCVLFLVAVNFSSLIPAAPGGLGVIEAVASAVLVSIGIPKEKALTMVLVQHVIQYLVVGIPGAVIMFTWKKQLKELKRDDPTE